MKATRHSYEDFQWAETPATVSIPEAYSGPAIVRWYQTLKYKLRTLIQAQEANRNNEYADLLRTYSNIWEKYPITGSMNRETLEVLKSSAEPYTKMDWNQQSFFVGLVTSLDELIADQEALPTGIDTEQNMPMAGGAGGMTPPLSPDFGPQESPPPGLGAHPGDGEGGTPGGEEGEAGGGPQPGQPGPGEAPQPGQRGQPGQVPPGPIPPNQRRPRPRV